MKKTQLRNIIKESIKELMTEQQSSTCPNGVHQGALQAAQVGASNPQLGNVGITQNFLNNMMGKNTNFYQQKANKFSSKAIQLNNNISQMFCINNNPMWQAGLLLKKIYAEQCRDNPGTC